MGGNLYHSHRKDIHCLIGNKIPFASLNEHHLERSIKRFDAIPTGWG
jgi:hypothetical protein